MKKSTKKVVVTEEHKGIKLFGALINLFGLAGYAVANTVVAINSVARVRMEATNLTFDQVIERVTKASLLESSLIFGTICLFEFINYYLYLNKKKDILLAFIAFNIMAFMVAAYKFGFTYIFSYIILLPALTGFINYYILVSDGK